MSRRRFPSTVCRIAWQSLALLIGLRMAHGQIQTAGDLVVELDAGDPSAGTAVWTNTASESMGDFEMIEAPIVEEIEGATAVTFNTVINASGVPDAYRSIEDAPEGLVGPDPTRSIEAWVYNPQVAQEETILSWGKRGDPAGENMSFNYGTDPAFGAVGHWGAAGPDLGWSADGESPAAGRWHHLVYTYDGATTRVYADGCVVDVANCETNFEDLGPGVINTFTPAKIALAAQNEPDGVTLNFPLRGTLSLGRVRIHDDVLTPAQIQNNYDVECPEFCPPAGLCECENCPVADQHFRGKPEYVRLLRFDAVPPPTGLTVVEPAGAAIAANGRLTYAIPNPAPASFNVRVQCANAVGTANFSWVVTLVDPPVRAGIDIAGELLVDLDARHASAGSSPWLNNGTLSDFEEVGDPVPAIFGPEDSPAIDFNAGPSLDAYQCYDFAPAGIIGVSPTRSIEVWAFNPAPIPGEETLVAWGRRGGPDGTNISFNYGTNPLFGAVGHWGAPDLGWNLPAGAPDPDLWHHLVYTYDGGETNTTRVYVDGLLANSEVLGPGTINTFGPSRITLAAQLDNATTLNTGLRGALAIGQVRIHDGVLSAQQVYNNFLAERERYGAPEPPVSVPTFANVPADDTFCAVADLYSFRLQADGVPPPQLEAVSPPGATIDAGGLLIYDIPDPPPASFQVTVNANNVAGTETASWSVNREDVSNTIQIAGDLFVDLDARDPTAGSDAWSNGAGALSPFVKVGNPQSGEIFGVQAVSFNPAGPAGDAYQSVEDAPEGLVGFDPTRTIEVWGFNPVVADEETLLAWGWRGDPAGSNMSFNYGTNGAFGAVGHWGAPDIGWNSAGGAPEARKWHHLVYTYDGETTRVYADGVETNSELLGPGIISTKTPSKITLAAQLELALDGITLQLNSPLQGRLAIARVRIHDEVLSACQVVSNYELERSQFEVPCPTPGQPDFADTHCTGIVVTETGAAFGPTHRVAATGIDDTGDPILYTYTASNGVNPTVTVGPTPATEGVFILRTIPGPFTFTVTVDDRPDCDDAAADATCKFPPDNLGPRLVRGDTNADGRINITDPIYSLAFSFQGGPPPPCRDAADADDSFGINITDPIYLLSFLFQGGPRPPAPSPSSGNYVPGDCGEDLTADNLDCLSFPPCP